MAGVVLFSRRVTDRAGARPVRIDLLSVLLSAAGLVFVVYGMLQSKTWGWVLPLHPPTIGGIEFAPLGVSPTTWFILAGAALIWAFVNRQRHLVATGRRPRGVQPTLTTSVAVRRSSTWSCSGSSACEADSTCSCRSTR